MFVRFDPRFIFAHITIQISEYLMLACELFWCKDDDGISAEPAASGTGILIFLDDLKPTFMPTMAKYSA